MLDYLENKRFSLPGESGAAVRQTNGPIIGMLWGGIDRGNLRNHSGRMLTLFGMRAGLSSVS